MEKKLNLNNEGLESSLKPKGCVVRIQDALPTAIRAVLGSDDGKKQETKPTATNGESSSGNTTKK